MIFGHALAHAAHAADQDEGVALGGDGQFVHGLHAVGLVVFRFRVINAIRPSEFAGYTNARYHVVFVFVVTHAHNGVFGLCLCLCLRDGLCHNLFARQPWVKLDNGASCQEVAGALVSLSGLKAHDALLLAVVPDVAELREGGCGHGQHVVVALAFQIGNLAISSDAEILEEFVGAIGFVLGIVRLFPDEQRVVRRGGMS